MQEFDCPEELPHDVLLVDILQDVCPDDSVQICLHEIEDKVDVTVIFSLVH